MSVTGIINSASLTQRFHIDPGGYRIPDVVTEVHMSLGNPQILFLVFLHTSSYFHDNSGTSKKIRNFSKTHEDFPKYDVNGRGTLKFSN